MNMHEQVMKILASHGTDEMLQFVSVAGFSAEQFLAKHPREFAKLYGSYGQRIIKKGMENPSVIE